MDKKVIFVGGCVRSGTTLLNLVVANDNRALALGEIQYVFRPKYKYHYDLLHELKKDEKWCKIISGGSSNLYKNIFYHFPNIDYLVDSSKNPDWYKEQMDANPELVFKNVVIFKHPADQKKSLLRRNPESNWKRIISNYYRIYFIKVPNFRSISLKDLLNSEDKLEKLCNHLEIPYFKDKLKYWNRKHPNFFGSDTVKKSMTDKTHVKSIASIEELKETFPEHTSTLISIYEFLLLKEISNNNYGVNKQFKMSKMLYVYLSIRNFFSNRISRLKVKIKCH